MPNAYFGASKEGCYMPLRLTPTHTHWTTEADFENVLNTNLVEVIGSNAVAVPSSPGLSSMPYYAVSPAVLDGPTLIKGDVVYKPQNGIWGGISRNLSIQTRYTMYFRVGVEVRVHPGTLLCSQQRMSPLYDPTALAAYHRINRELKDAYPVDFNDLGKLWEVIKSAAKVVLPVVGGMGPIGAAVSGIGGGAIAGIDAIRQALKPPGANRGADSPAAASVERAQAQQKVREARVSGTAVKKARKKAVNRRKK
jgi:hypothetical protein